MKPWRGTSMPSDGSELPPVPAPPGAGRNPGGRATRMLLPVLAGLAGLLLAGWMITAYLRRPQSGSLEDTLAQGGAPGSAAPSNLAADRYNAVLQVRVKGAHGEMVAVGTNLPRKLTLTLHDAAGNTYAEVFDRVGLWAIEVPPGTYVIPRDQPDLAHWTWVLTGEGVVPVPGKGYSVAFAAGRVNPTIDLLLQ